MMAKSGSSVSSVATMATLDSHAGTGPPMRWYAPAQPANSSHVQKPNFAQP